MSSKTTPSAFNIYRRPFEDLFTYSARPLSYFLPPTTHPFFGRFTEGFIGSPYYGISFTEHALYLGWIPLILAFTAFNNWRMKRKRRSYVSSNLSDAREDFYIGFFIFLAIAAWFFSQPPWWRIGLFKIYMPSFFMHKLLPMYRAYGRFGFIVMLAVSILAAFGLKFILDKLKSGKMKVIIATFFCVLIIFEFWNYPPFKVIDVSKVPAAYYWLKDQEGDFALAEYPLDINGTNEMYEYYQTKHEKKIINGSVPGTYANDVAKTIAKLSSMGTAGVLKWMEVKYVFVHRVEYLRTELDEQIKELNKIPKNQGLKFLKQFPAQGCTQNIKCTQETGPIDVYEVVARHPIRPQIKE